MAKEELSGECGWRMINDEGLNAKLSNYDNGIHRYGSTKLKLDLIALIEHLKSLNYSFSYQVGWNFGT